MVNIFAARGVLIESEGKLNLYTMVEERAFTPFEDIPNISTARRTFVVLWYSLGARYILPVSAA